MHTILDNFHQGGKYSSQIANHQIELGREEKLTEQKPLKILSLQTDYLNIDSTSDFVRDSERAHAVQIECNCFGGVNHSAEKCFKKKIKVKEKARAVDVSSHRHMKLTPRKCFRCGSENHIIEKCPKQLCFNERGNRACDNGENNSDYKIYAYMAQMSSNDECKNCGKTEN